MKNLQEIKDEYANEQGRDCWDEFLSWNELTHTGIGRMQYHHDQIAIRYAQEQNKEFQERKEYEDDFDSISESVLKYMNSNHHPHCTLIATSTNVQVVEGIKSTGETLQYIKD